MLLLLFQFPVIVLAITATIAIFIYRKLFWNGNFDNHTALLSYNDVEKNWTILGGKKENLALEDVPVLHKETKEAFASGLSRPIEFRLKQLHGIKRFFEEREDDIKAALKKDLYRPDFEAMYYDVLLPMGEVDYMIRNLRSLASPESVGFNLLTFPSVNEIYKEPYGAVLVVGTWNYPIMLTMVPVIGAIAAGNTVVLKPSNISSECAKLLEKLLPLYVDRRVLTVIGPNSKGDRDMTGALMKHHWDYVFFTGSPTVGKVIYEAAARNLTPVTLELGGKNPVLVDADADVQLAAKRCVWGRMMNAGQQCISPDYVLCHRDILPAFVSQLAKNVSEFYGSDPMNNGNLGRIVGDRQMDRIVDILNRHGGKVICGGNYKRAERYVEPTVIQIEDLSSIAMEEETFAPILLVVPVDSMRSAIQYVNSRPKSLSLYIFSNSRATQEEIIYNTASGGVTVNGTLWHVAHSGMPFGGVGASGIGAYHGKLTFETFSHRKPVLRKAAWTFDKGLLSDPFFVYPPWSDRKAQIIRFLSKFA